MRQDATSLDRLNDLVLPPEPPWWPPAPGWYVAFGLVILGLTALLVRGWSRWCANRYRRAALGELATARDTAAIAELLRRTALATTPRSRIAELTGESWFDWLEAQCPDAMPQAVRAQLARVYGPAGSGGDVRAIREYAALWIKRHHVPGPEDPSTPC